MGQLFVIQDLPRILPAICELRRLSVTSCDVEPKFAGWGNGLLVEFSELRCKAHGLWRLLADIAELGQQKVCWWAQNIVVFAPGVGLGAERGGDGMYGFVGFVLTFAHESIALSRGDQREMLGWFAWKRDPG